MHMDQKVLHADGFTYGAAPSDIVQLLMGLTTPKTAIDIGAGAGRNVALLLQKGCEVTAVECGPESLTILHEMAMKHPQFTVAENTLQSVDTSTQYDAVLCNMTLHFLQSNEIATAITTLQSLTTPNGFVCISSYIECAENESLSNIYTYKFPPSALRNYFNGWKIHYYTEDYPVPAARLRSGGINGGKGYISARIVAQKLS